jgi:hypothetical protein
MEQVEAKCARCGAAMACTPEGDCWCMAVPAVLPVPKPGEPAGCFCRRCLDEAAAQSICLEIASSRM